MYLLIVICLFNAGKFAMDFPEAMQEDTDEQLSEDCVVDDDIPPRALFLGGCKVRNTHQYVPGVAGDFEAQWHPGPAWFIMFVVIPGFAAFEYFRLKEINERGYLSQYESASSRKSKNSILIPEITKSGISVPEITSQAPVQVGQVVESPKIQKKTGKSGKKKFKPKQVMVDIECPSCDVVMSVPKLDKMQEVKCKACGLSGEIEI